MATKRTTRRKLSPLKRAEGRAARRAEKGAANVLAWEDDPLSGAAPVVTPAPAVGHTPYPLRILGRAYPPVLHPRGTPGFRYWDAAVALRRAADFWGSIVPAGTGWQPGGVLRATLDHGKDLNAYYDRRGLWFFHDSVEKTTVFSGESPDILCHELGHAILDSIRPDLWDTMSAEVAAFHESFGDMSSILAGLEVPSFRLAVLKETSGHLARSSRLSRLAEQLGWAIRQFQPDAVDPDCLRNAVNSFFYRDPLTIPHSGPASHLTSEPHSFSRVFTAGFFEALGGMVSASVRGRAGAPLKASRDAAHLLVDAVLAAPVVPRYYSQVAAHMVEADQARFGGRYAGILRSAFVRRGILSLGSAATLGPAAMASSRRAAGSPTPAAEGRAKTLALPAEDFALGAGKLHIQAASAVPRFRVAPAAPTGGALEPVSGVSAARAFLAYLFRRGRVDLGEHGDDETRVAHPLARKTHELVKKNKSLSIVRRTFDCGFDCA
jgi:hypothetical protein